MSTKARYINGILTFYDSVTNETIRAEAPLFKKEDFLGQAVDTTNGFGFRDTAGATEALVANAASGVLRLALTSTNEAQLAGIDYADQLSLILSQGIVFESRVKLSTLPTTGSVACIGLSSAHNAAVDSVVTSAWFRLDGATGGLITVECDDGTTETSKVTTGTTVTTADWVVLKIDASDATNVLFYINGSRVASSTTFSMNATPTVGLQPVARMGKESSGTNVGSLDVDYLMFWQKRS